jgi:hypothetical protein
MSLLFMNGVLFTGRILPVFFAVRYHGTKQGMYIAQWASMESGDIIAMTESGRRLSNVGFSGSFLSGLPNLECSQTADIFGSLRSGHRLTISS